MFAASGPLIVTLGSGMTVGFSAVLLPQLKDDRSTIKISSHQESWIGELWNNYRYIWERASYLPIVYDVSRHALDTRWHCLAVVKLRTSHFEGEVPSILRFEKIAKNPNIIVHTNPIYRDLTGSIVVIIITNKTSLTWTRTLYTANTIRKVTTRVSKCYTLIISYNV